jgi:hypothetical protein
MADTDPEPQRSTPYLRLPWPAVAGALVLVLALALGLGLYASQAMRSRSLTATASPQGNPTSPVSAATPGPGATSAPQPTLVSNAAPLVGADARTPNPAATPAVSTALPGPTADTVLVAGPASQATGAALLASTPPPIPPLTATPLIPAVPPETPAPSPAARDNPSPTPTVDPILADEVGQAYVAFWKVRSQALLDLDETHIAEVMDGDYLDNMREVIGNLRNEGHAIRTKVELNYSVLQAANSDASVLDIIVDNSVYVNVATNEPESTPEGGRLVVLYQLKKDVATWKVVDSVRNN